MRVTSLTALAATAALAFASPAAAQSGGVFIDPGSPSAKEYGIPLETARREANPAADRNAPIEQGQRTSPLFGEGISAPPDRGTKGRGAEGSPSADGAPAGSGSGGVTPPHVIQAASNPGTPTGGASTPVIVGGVGLGVLALGGGAGLLLRRRRG
jgi:hypothetical protein